MGSQIRLTRKELQSDPNLLWNSFINFLATSKPELMDAEQKAPYLVFWYESEVQNGGHLQYFENRGIDEGALTIDALHTLSAHAHAMILERACHQYKSQTRKALTTSEQYAEEARKGEFELLDEQFWRSEPSLVQALEQYLQLHFSKFIVVTD